LQAKFLFWGNENGDNQAIKRLARANSGGGWCEACGVARAKSGGGLMWGIWGGAGKFGLRSGARRVGAPVPVWQDCQL